MLSIKSFLQMPRVFAYFYFRSLPRKWTWFNTKESSKTFDLEFCCCHPDLFKLLFAVMVFAGLTIHRLIHLKALFL